MEATLTLRCYVWGHSRRGWTPPHGSRGERRPWAWGSFDDTDDRSAARRPVRVRRGGRAEGTDRPAPRRSAADASRETGRREPGGGARHRRRGDGAGPDAGGGTGDHVRGPGPRRRPHDRRRQRGRPADGGGGPAHRCPAGDVGRPAHRRVQPDHAPDRDGPRSRRTRRAVGGRTRRRARHRGPAVAARPGGTPAARGHPPGLGPARCRDGARPRGDAMGRGRAGVRRDRGGVADVVVGVRAGVDPRRAHRGRTGQRRPPPGTRCRRRGARPAGRRAGGTGRTALADGGERTAVRGPGPGRGRRRALWCPPRPPPGAAAAQRRAGPAGGRAVARGTAAGPGRRARPRPPQRARGPRRGDRCPGRWHGERGVEPRRRGGAAPPRRPARPAHRHGRCPRTRRLLRGARARRPGHAAAQRRDGRAGRRRAVPVRLRVAAHARAGRDEPADQRGAARTGQSGPHRRVPAGRPR